MIRSEFSSAELTCVKAMRTLPLREMGLVFVYQLCFLLVGKQKPLDLGFILGAAGSNAAAIFKTELDFAKSLISSYIISPSQTQVGAITYGAGANLAFSLNAHSSKSAVSSALGGVRNPGNGANIGAALQLARTSLFSQENGARDKVQKTLVIFANEKFGGNNAEIQTELQALRAAGIRIVIVGIGGNVDKKQVNEIASHNAVFFPLLLEEMDLYLYPVYRATLRGEPFLLDIVALLYRIVFRNFIYQNLYT